MTCAANAFKDPALSKAYSREQAARICSCVLESFLYNYTGDQLRHKFQNYGPVESQETYNFTYHCATQELAAGGETTYL